MKIKKQLKRLINFYYDWEKIIDITSCFMLILAFVIVLPSLVEMQMGFIAAICTLSIGLKMMFGRLKKEFPALEKETKNEHAFNEKIYELDSEIKSIKRRQEKIEKANKKKKK